MSRIAGRLAELKTASKKALIPYFVSGDPSLSATVDMMHALVDSGADILEFINKRFQFLDFVILVSQLEL